MLVTPKTRVYLAGHAGLVGSAIFRALQARGYEDIVTRTHAELDLADQAATSKFLARERPELVILAAARVGGILANWERPYEFIYDNLAIQLNVLDAAFRSGVRRLLFLGSSCIYPRLAPQPLREEYLLTGPLEETNRPYALAKIAGIELCRSLNREYSTEYLGLMPTNMFGPGDNFDLHSSHVLPAILRKCHEAKLGLPDEAGNPRPPQSPITLWGTGTPRRELLYIDDLADAVVFLLEKDSFADIPDALINIGRGSDLEIREIAELVQRVVGHTGTIEWDAGKPDGTPRKLLDISRMDALGWKAPTNLEEGVRRTYDWYLTNATAKRGETGRIGA